LGWDNTHLCAKAGPWHAHHILQGWPEVRALRDYITVISVQKEVTFEYSYLDEVNKRKEEEEKRKRA
jgi:hypothetical protein